MPLMAYKTPVNTAKDNLAAWNGTVAMPRHGKDITDAKRHCTTVSR